MAAKVHVIPAGSTDGAVLAICRSQLCLSRLAEVSSLQAAMYDAYTAHLHSGSRGYAQNLERLKKLSYNEGAAIKCALKPCSNCHGKWAMCP